MDELRFDQDNPSMYEKQVKIIGYKDGDMHDLKSFKLEPFSTTHWGVGHGVTVHEPRTKISQRATDILTEARSKHVNPNDLRRLGKKLRDEGEFTKEWINFLTYTSDSARDIHDDPHVLNTNHLITETTYLDDEDCELARSRGHVCLKDIKKLLDDEGLVAKDIILTHFSVKHEDDEITDHMKSLHDDRVSWLPSCKI